MKEDQFEKDLDRLAKSFLKIRNIDEAKNYVKDLFSKTELKTMVLRYNIATMLHKGIPYVEIERETGASSATIARISESLKYGNDGLRLIMERMQRAR
ncbi:hypothetical protein GF389_05870 [Candidatus Dojkabacteria bacterium]|nr:hypothetical protein [Candidatus Dojkabacteria bacterium]